MPQSPTASLLGWPSVQAAQSGDRTAAPRPFDPCTVAEGPAERFFRDHLRVRTPARARAQAHGPRHHGTP
ncbi:hypothetical protein FDK12_07930 [Arthrobacter sp. NamB2]|uniref:hypothetical protein n=1 Tax=Arthrobacter sp. NamB2 TaxID=2576035 RepID=UPI0010C9597F|nr:hypothetical protein [Arthrobacter sp. NamB2]TKV28578.1 hypothetical protein FDK12_07930 [Arthrobacter sp. NamB2]